MSAPSAKEYADLLTGYVHRELDETEVRRLQALADEDPQRRHEVDSFTHVHALFDSEKVLRQAVSSADDRVEQADEGYRRLLRRAGAAENLLRNQIAFRQVEATPRVNRRSSQAWWLLAAAVLLAVTWWMVPANQPQLIDGTPQDQRLGTPARILLTPELSIDQPMLTWHAALGARSYDAWILGPEGTLLHRAPEERASLRWQLTTEQVGRLARFKGDLFLRIEGRDSADQLIATSGDLPLRVR